MLSYSPSFALTLFIYTVRVLSFTKLPATSQILSKICSRVIVLLKLLYNNSKILYSSAVKLTSTPLTNTFVASVSILTSPHSSLFPLSNLLKITLILETSSLFLKGFTI